MDCMADLIGLDGKSGLVNWLQALCRHELAIHLQRRKEIEA
jgi:hypothetical protein